MKEKAYKGYQSFEYLAADEDYKVFEMAKQVNRVPSYRWDLTEKETRVVERLMEENMVVSLHEHPTVMPKNMDNLIEYMRTGRERTAYKGLSVSGLDAVFDNLMDGTALITSKRGWKWQDVIYDLGMRLSDLAHQDFVLKAEDIDDLTRAEKEGKIALIFTIEALTPIENEIDRIDVLYGLGIRSMGVTYSESNSLGSGLKEKRDGGLTALGEQAVKRMNRLGVIVDVSHCGDLTSLDVISASEKPILISHAGSRAVWDTPRMKPDEVIIACAEKGGVVGIEAAPHTTISQQHRQHSIESVMDHFEYCIDLVGIDHVSFGPDSLFGDHVALHEAFSSHLSASYKKEGPSYKEVEYVAGMENPGECYQNIVRWLIKAGYSEDEIAKVIGGNALRVIKEVWNP